MNIREIDKEIGRLNAIRRDLQEKEVERKKELARKFVGKCYRDIYGTALKIVGIPQTRLTMTNQIYDENEFPAVFVNHPTKISETCISNDELSLFAPCYCANVLFYQWDENQNKNYDGLTEISQEEFDFALDQSIDLFRRLMKNESNASN